MVNTFQVMIVDDPFETSAESLLTGATVTLSLTDHLNIDAARDYIARYGYVTNVKIEFTGELASIPEVLDFPKLLVYQDKLYLVGDIHQVYSVEISLDEADERGTYTVGEEVQSS